MNSKHSSFTLKVEDSKLEYPDIPTMISEEEKKYLYFLGSEYWTGSGSIVEIGPWLGGSTYCLASGLSVNMNYADQKIFVYDNFVWRDFMNVRAGLNLRNEDDFLPFFEKNLESFKEYIVPIKASLPDEEILNDVDAVTKRQTHYDESNLIRYDSEQKIEILFIDGAKSWSGTKYLLDEFKSNLIPDTSLLICQDYKYWGCYWIIIIFELLMDKMEVEHILPFNTVSFKLTGEITKTDIEAIPDWTEIHVDTMLKKIDAAALRINSLEGFESCLIVKLNKVKFLAHKGEIEAAQAQLVKLIKQHPFYLSKTVFTPITTWFNKAYGKNVTFRETIYWLLKNLIKRVIRKFKPGF